MLDLILQLSLKGHSHWRRSPQDFLSSPFSTLLVTVKHEVIYFANISVFSFKNNE